MGSTRYRHTAGMDVARDRPEGPLPQNEIVRVRTSSQGPIREGRAPIRHRAAKQHRVIGPKAANHLPVIRERPNNQCSTG